MFGPLPAIVDRGIGQLERCGDPVASRLKGVGMFPKSVDVTGITGAQVVGPPVSWQTPNGPFNVEHVARRQCGERAAGVLVVTAARLAGRQPRPRRPASTSSEASPPGRRRNGPFLVEHLAARSPERRSDCVLVVAAARLAGGQRLREDRPARRRRARELAHLRRCCRRSSISPRAGSTTSCSCSGGPPSHDWQVVDVTAKTGRSVSQDPTAWLSRNGPMVVEHLGAASPDGTLSVFWWSPAHDWQAINVSAHRWRHRGRPHGQLARRHRRARRRPRQSATNCSSTGGRQRRTGAGLTSRRSPASRSQRCSGVYQLGEAGENSEILVGARRGRCAASLLVAAEPRLAGPESLARNRRRHDRRSGDVADAQRHGDHRACRGGHRAHGRWSSCTTTERAGG